MSSAAPNTGAQPQNPQGGANVPPNTGAPPGAPSGQPPYGSPGQPPYPYGGYAPPPGAPGYYPPPPTAGQYYPPPGQYQYPYPGYYPPPVQYAPPPGQYPLPSTPGQYPPPTTPGAQAAPAPGAPGTALAPGGTNPQYTPPAGPPPAGQYPPPNHPPYGAPQPPFGSPYAIPGYPAPPGGAMAQGYPAPMHQDPLVYLGTAIPDPAIPPAPLGAQKLPGYDPAHDYTAIIRATAHDAVNESQRQSLSPSSLSPISPAERNSSVSRRSTSSTRSSLRSQSGVEPPSPTMPAAEIAQIKTNHRPSAMSSAFRTLTSHAANALTLETKYTSVVMKVLMNLNVFQMNALNDYFTGKQGVTLTDHIERTTTGNFGIAARALTLGPLGYDVDLAHKSLAGFGTNEMLLTELILGRPGHEIRWLKTAYKLRYGKDLVDAVKSDLSGSMERMFVMALNTQKPTSGPYDIVDHNSVNADVETLHTASKKKEEIKFFEILINRSDQHLAAVITAFGQRYKSLSKVIKKTFSGTIETSLLFIVHGVKPKRDQQGIWRDAKLLEKSMAGLGTKDVQLIYRLVRTYWNPQRMEAIKDAYKRRFGKPLENRVKGETSGTYRELLIAIVNSSAAVQQRPPQ